VTVTIGNIRASRPTVTTTASDQVSTLWPREARLRNLTYSASIFVEMTQTTERTMRDGSEEPQKSSKTMNYRLCMVRVEGGSDGLDSGDAAFQRL
jgi:DNA-directed RNA polymerase